MINFEKYKFSSVIDLPSHYEVYDFSKNYDENRALNTEYGIGKYDERRADNMYTGSLYEDRRNIHMGIDIAAPIGTPIHIPYSGNVYLFAYNSQPLDYGYTLITEHKFGDVPLYILFGHLSKKSIEGKTKGLPFKSGDVIAWVGEKHENGGWNPHLHIQLSYEKPSVCDMPGVVNESQYVEAKKKYPDPRLILGPLY